MRLYIGVALSAFHVSHSNMLTHIRTEADLDAALSALGEADPRFVALMATAGRPMLRRRPDVGGHEGAGGRAG